MIRKSIIMACTILALGVGGLMLGTSFWPLVWTRPADIGSLAYGVAVRGGGLLANYWRFVDNPPLADRRIDLEPLLYYEMEVRHGASGYSARYREPFPHGFAVTATRGTLVTTVLSGNLWLPLLILSVYPIIAFIRGPLRRWHRTRKGLCIDCGYDLTANVTGVCPECGARI